MPVNVLHMTDLFPYVLLLSGKEFLGLYLYLRMKLVTVRYTLVVIIVFGS